MQQEAIPVEMHDSANSPNEGKGQMHPSEAQACKDGKFQYTARFEWRPSQDIAAYELGSA